MKDADGVKMIYLKVWVEVDLIFCRESHRVVLSHGETDGRYDEM